MMTGTDPFFEVAPFPNGWFATGDHGPGDQGEMFTFTLVGGAVPEPSTWAMTLAGFAGLGWLTRMRRRKLTPA